MNRKEQRAVDQALQSIAECNRRDPVAPTMRPEDEIVCQGAARNRALEVCNGG